MFPQLLRGNEYRTLVLSDSVGRQFLSNREVRAGSTPLLATGDKSATTVIIPLLEQAANKRAQHISHMTGSHPPPAAMSLTDVLRKAEGARLIHTAVDLCGFRIMKIDLKRAGESLQSNVLENNPVSELCSVKPCLQELVTHVVLVAGSEERHVQLQPLAVVAHDVAVPGCQLGRQRVRVDGDLPQVVERPVRQSEADPRVRTGSIDGWRS